MAYIGNVPAEKYSALTQQTFSSPTGTSFTLSTSVTNSKDIALFIDNVRQDPASYTASGTALTTSTIASPSTMYCLFNGRTTETVNPPDSSVGTAQVTDDAITLAKLAPGTDGNIISFDASGNPVAVATGTDGQVLTSTGAGSPPAFEALPSSGADTDLSNLSETGQQQTCKAWVNFNGTGTIAIRDDFNIASLTDHGTGTYSINFTTAMPNVNYAVAYAGGQKSATWGIYIGTNTYGSTTGAHKFQNNADGDTLTDTVYCSLIVFGD